MKKLNAVTILLTILAAATTVRANNGDVNMKRNVYVANCQYTSPLFTYERCDEGSRIGHIAAACAQNQALDECEADLNVDCIPVSVQVWAENSVEFVGYKKCVAKARVHGYQVRR